MFCCNKIEESQIIIPTPNPFNIPQLYLIPDKNDLKDEVRKVSKEVFNTIYSDKFEQSRFTKILNYQNIFPKTIADIYISETEKIADKNGWLKSKKNLHGVRQQILTESMLYFVKNLMYSSVFKIIEDEYNLPKWSNKV